MAACQSVTGNWLAMRVEARSARSSMTSVKIAPLSVAQRCDHPVVDGKQVELREAGQQPSVGAVAAADGELVQQARHADVACGEAAATGPFDERATEEALSDPGGTEQDQVVAFGDPCARRRGSGPAGG